MSSLPTKYELAPLFTAGKRIAAAAIKLQRLRDTIHSLTPDLREVSIRQALDQAESAGLFLEEALGVVRKCRTILPPEGELPERPPPGIES